MLVKLAIDLAEFEKFFQSNAGKRTAIGAGIGAVAGASMDKNNRVTGAMSGAALGGAAGFVGHHTGAIDAVKTHFNSMSDKIKQQFAKKGE